VSSESGGFGLMRLSTAGVPERHRMPLWREMFGRQVVRADLAFLSEGPLEAEVTLRALPGLRTMACVTPLGRMARSPELLADGDDDLALLINGSGAMAPSALGREASLGAGDAILTLNAVPSAMTFSELSSVVLVPRAALAPLVTNAEDKAMRVIPPDTDALRLLVNYMRMLHDDLDIATPGLASMAATHVHDLVALAIGANRDGGALAQERGLRAARLAAIKADMAARAGDRNLTLAAVAGRHRISPRSVQLLFETEGTTFSQFLLRERLARAHRMLSSPRCAAMTVSAIAFAAGFGDLSHFNRDFRRRYGATPSEVRAAGAG
jgi:AraC-like DNA-binding protein